MSARKAKHDPSAPQLPNTPTNGKMQTALYLPSEMRARLARYTTEKHDGRLNMRNAVILEAIDAYLKSAGY